MIGLPLAMGAGRLISAQLYGVSFWDPLALAIAAGAGALRVRRGDHSGRPRRVDFSDARAQERVKTERSPFTRSFLRRSSKPIPSVAFSQAILRGLLVAMWLRAA